MISCPIRGHRFHPQNKTEKGGLAKNDRTQKATKVNPAKRRPGRPPIEGPTARQREILEFIRAARQTGDRPPSIDEIRLHLNFKSTFAVRTHLLALEKKGLLHIARNSHRGISLSDNDRAVRNTSRLVPLLGDAPAGSPTEAIEQTDEHISVDPALFPQEDVFAIRVRGNSMLDAGIHDHDVALIRPNAEATAETVVLARLNNEVTLKRLRFKKGKPYLHPENAEYIDIFVEDGDDLSIIGVLVGIIRKY